MNAPASAGSPFASESIRGGSGHRLIPPPASLEGSECDCNDQSGCAAALPGFITAPGETDMLMVIMGGLPARRRFSGRPSVPAAAQPARAHGAQDPEAAVRDRRRARPDRALHPHAYLLDRGPVARAWSTCRISARRSAASRDRSRGSPHDAGRDRREPTAEPNLRRQAGARPLPAEQRSTTMLELMLCSLLTILPDYLYRRYRAGQADRPGDHPLLGLVRAALGHHALPDADDLADHDDLLLPSVDHQRDVLSSGPCRSCRKRTGRVAEVYVGLSQRGEKGAPLFRLDSSRAGGGARDRRAARSPRSTRR